MYSTIALFVYKRAEHARIAVESLLKNKEAAQSKLVVFSDAPKRQSDYDEVNQVREYIRKIDGFASVQLIERDENYGLAKSIISGVSSILEKEDTVIVVEDDLCLSPHFLKYMNDGLEVYRDCNDVASIHGYIYPVTATLPETFFLKGADCWGWATWKRAWAHFNPDGRQLLDELLEKKLCAKFDYFGAAKYVRMLRGQITGKNDSWAIRWHASAFLKDMYTLYPGKSLVFNTGMDGGGTHSSSTDRFNVPVAESPIIIKRLEVKEDPDIVRIVGKAILAAHGNLFRKAIVFARTVLKV